MSQSNAEEIQGEKVVSLLDYGAGNVRSIRNALKLLGYRIIDIETPQDIENAHRIIFPGVGAFGTAVETLKRRNLFEPLRLYLKNFDRPFLGICIGMQILFESSDESLNVEGLGIIPGKISKLKSNFNERKDDPSIAKVSVPVPHIGWNSCFSDNPYTYESTVTSNSTKPQISDYYYFVHSFCALPNESNKSFINSLTSYGEANLNMFISSVAKGKVFATQFHPEKSSNAGLNLIRRFLENETLEMNFSDFLIDQPLQHNTLRKRIIACLDVRANDQGKIVVTKGNQYNVRESKLNEEKKISEVRDLGCPVRLARQYYEQGADEIVFLNITGFRKMPVEDLPMNKILEETSSNVFVPLTIGGGIRDYVDLNGVHHSALEVADSYFRSGADKISIGSSAVDQALSYLNNGRKLTGESSLEQISSKYGSQAVVVSVDAKISQIFDMCEVPQKYERYPTDVKLFDAEDDNVGENGERYYQYQCTVNGGRKLRPLCAFEFVNACEQLGAGEILLNLIDRDGTKKGFDTKFIDEICNEVNIPVIASSGAGKIDDFVDVFEKTSAQAALAAGIFHRNEVLLTDLKSELKQVGIPLRIENNEEP